jgi:hypothetical protein
VQIHTLQSLTPLSETIIEASLKAIPTTIFQQDTVKFTLTPVFAATSSRFCINGIAAALPPGKRMQHLEVRAMKKVRDKRGDSFSCHRRYRSSGW